MREKPTMPRILRGPGQVEAATDAADTSFELVCYFAEQEYELAAAKFGKDSPEAVAADQAWKNAGRLARRAKADLVSQVKRDAKNV